MLGRSYRKLYVVKDATNGLGLSKKLLKKIIMVFAKNKI
jgi:hypothetical protein